MWLDTPVVPEADAGTCIAFDFGTRRIGLAVGEPTIGTASPAGTARNNSGTPEWTTIDALIERWQPTDLIVGWPLSESGEEQDITHHTKGFIKRLKKRYQLPVHTVDERYSSIAAQQEMKQLRQRGQRKRKTTHADIDTLAAALILESWFTMKSQP